MANPIYQVQPIAYGRNVPDLLCIQVIGDEKKETFQAIFKSIVESIYLPSTMATKPEDLLSGPGYKAILYLPPTYPTIEKDIPYLREINRKAALASQIILDQGKEVSLQLYRNSLFVKEPFVFKPNPSRLT